MALLYRLYVNPMRFTSECVAAPRDRDHDVPGPLVDFPEASGLAGSGQKRNQVDSWTRAFAVRVPSVVKRTT